MGDSWCHPDDLRCCPISSGWPNVIQTLSHPDELAHGRISPGWLMSNDDLLEVISHQDEFRENHYVIRMTYAPVLSHPDEITNFKFPQLAVVLRGVRKIRHQQWSTICIRVVMPLTRHAKLWVAHAPGMPGTFFPPPISKETVSDPDMHHGTCATHVPRCMLGSLTHGGGENIPGIPGACAARSYAYLVGGPIVGVWSPSVGNATGPPTIT